MITTITVVSPEDATYPDLVLPVVNPDDDELLPVRDVAGIDAIDATINTGEYAGDDGDYYYGSRIGKRNIVLTLGLTSVEESLPLIYGYFMPQSYVTLQFDVDGFPDESVYISGWVEKTPYNHFSPDPEVQVSIICPEPNFVSAPEAVTGETGSEIDSPVMIEYSGNKVAGFELALAAEDDPYEGPVVIEVSQGAFVGGAIRHLEIDPVVLETDEVLYVNTIRGSKNIYVVNGDNLVGKMSGDSFWLTFWPGDDGVRVRTPEDGITRNWVLTYRRQYGGI